MPISYGPEQAWPPADVKTAQPFYREWLTWWRGQTDELTKLYQERAQSPNTRPPSMRSHGVVGIWHNFWYGRGSLTGITRMHVPAAKDVSSISAALLFADPPTFGIPTGKSKITDPAKGVLISNPQQDRLDAILNDAGVYVALHEAAQKSSAAGGVYLRASADATRADMPIVEAILPDCAAPEFYGPFLTAVTFWTRLARDRGSVVRHLERHEMLGKVCVVYHAVYEGSDDRLGRPAALADHPETARFAELVDADGKIVIGTTVLDVQYVPNDRPHPLIEGTQLGRSDYAGAEGEMDALDEGWASWLRDLRNGKGRIVVPKSYVRRGEAGAGGSFDMEQEVFTQVNAQVGNQDSAQLAMTISQFAIRVTEHRDTTAELWRIILKNAGLDGTENSSEATPETATKTNDKASRKRSTRATKIRYYTPALKRMALVLQELDALYFGGRPALPVDIEWPDAAAPDAEALARTVQLLDAAGAVSEQTKVSMVHPDWDDDQVREEVERIKGDAPAPPDPADPNINDPLIEPEAEPVDDGIPA